MQGISLLVGPLFSPSFPFLAQPGPRWQWDWSCFLCVLPSTCSTHNCPCGLPGQPQPAQPSELQALRSPQASRGPTTAHLTAAPVILKGLPPSPPQSLPRISSDLHPHKAAPFPNRSPMLPLQAPSPYSLLSSYDSHTLLPFGVLRVFEF